MYLVKQFHLMSSYYLFSFFFSNYAVRLIFSSVLVFFAVRLIFCFLYNICQTALSSLDKPQLLSRRGYGCRPCFKCCHDIFFIINQSTRNYRNMLMLHDSFNHLRHNPRQDLDAVRLACRTLASDIFQRTGIMHKKRCTAYNPSSFARLICAVLVDIIPSALVLCLIKSTAISRPSNPLTRSRCTIAIRPSALTRSTISDICRYLE